MKKITKTELKAILTLLEIVISENVVRTLIPKLKGAGAQGIIEYPLNKLIY